MNFFTYPNQRLSYAEKTKDDNRWAKRMIDYLALSHISYNDDFTRMISNYRLYNNIIDQKDFERDCNILGLQVDQFKELILPYNKTPNKINVLIADEMKRPFKYMVGLLDASSIKKKEGVKSKMMYDWMETHVQEITLEYQLKQLPEDSSEEDKQALQLQQQSLNKKRDNLIPPEQIDKWYKTKYRDGREIASEKILNYLEKVEHIQEKKADGFKHGLLSGKEVAWIGVEGNKPVVKIMNSPFTFHQKSESTKYIQDGLYAGSKTFATVADVLATYSEFLDDEHIESLDRFWGFNSSVAADSHGQTMQYDFSEIETSYYSNMNSGNNGYGQYDKSTSSQIMVVHVEWVSQRQIGFLSFINDYGDPETILVDENFKLPTDAKKEMKWKDGKKTYCHYFSLIEQDKEGKTITKEYKYEEDWIPQVWEGVRIGEKIYCCIGPKKYPYFSIQNPKKHKLGYHGVIYSNTNAPAISIMDRMKPYQHLFFACMHKLRTLIAKDKGKVFHLDETMIPDSLGIEKTLYYLDELNLDIYNPLKSKELPGGFNNSKITGSTDRSNMQHILNYINLLNYLDTQISEAAGVNKGREGQSFSNQAVTTAQQDLVQSSLVTEIYFSIHNTLWEDILNYLLSTARKYYKDNHITHLQYVLDDLSMEVINLTEDDLEEADLGVFVSNSMKENRVFETLNQISQALIQNDKSNLSHIISILESESLAELKREVKVFEEEQSAQQQAQLDQQMKLQQDAQAYARETMQIKENMVTDREIRKAEINVYARQQDLDQDNDGVPDMLEIEQFKLKMLESDRKSNIEEKKLKLKEKEIKIKQQIADKSPTKSK